MVLMPFDMESSRLAMSPARLLQDRGGEEVGRVVESRVDLQAGGETVLRLRHQVGGGLEGQEVRRTPWRDYIGHFMVPFWVPKKCASS